MFLSAHHISHKQHSPNGGQSSRGTSNLRVVIPTPMTPNMSAGDDLSYAEVSIMLNFGHILSSS